MLSSDPDNATDSQTEASRKRPASDSDDDKEKAKEATPPKQQGKKPLPLCSGQQNKFVILAFSRSSSVDLALPWTSSAAAATASSDESKTPFVPLSEEDRRRLKERRKREQEGEERERMQVLVSNLTEEQLDRYEMFRRAAFPKASVKRVMQTITGCSVGQNVVIAMAGIAKVFAGEVIEAALDYVEETSGNQESEGETAAESGIRPKHLREAVRRLRESGKIAIPKTKKKCPFN